MEDAGSKGHEKEQARYADATQLALLFDSTATWLDDHVPLYISFTEYAHGQSLFYKGLPLIKDTLPFHAIEIPGELAVEIEPDAARELDITAVDSVEISYVPAHYQQSEDPSDKPELIGPSCSYKTETQQSGRQGTFCFTANNAYVNWSGVRPAQTHSAQELDNSAMLESEWWAYSALSARLDDFKTALIERGLYPKDPLEYRRDQELEYYADLLVRRFEKEALRNAEAALGRVVTCGMIDTVAARQLLFARSEAGRAFEEVAPEDVESLRIAALTELARAQKSEHQFDQSQLQEVSVVFHNDKLSSQTEVTDISLKVHSSRTGPVVTFTLTKEIVRKDGQLRVDVEAFAFNGAVYLRQIAIVDSHSRPSSIAVQKNSPMTKAQFEVLQKLVLQVNDSSL